MIQSSPDTIELLPCPFCGGEPGWICISPGNWFVQCVSCRAASNDVGRKRAMELWNARAPARFSAGSGDGYGYGGGAVVTIGSFSILVGEGEPAHWLAQEIADRWNGERNGDR